MKQVYKAAWVLLSVVMLTACTTQKRKGELSGLGKLYHNTTAHYNGYFNASVLLAESTLELENQYQDNYNHVLPIYKYVEAENPKAVAEPLNKAIEKVSVVVNLHRVSQWSDDCYLVMGQAQYLQQDYEAAEETLEFMMGEYNPLEVAKREAKTSSAKKRRKAAKKGETVTADGEKIKLSKKEKEKLAKKKRKEREKERKQKIKESKKRRKGKKPSSSRGKSATDKAVDTGQKTTGQEEQPEEEITDENALPAPGSISLGNLGNDVVESDPESYFMKHRPAYQEGVLWLARTYIERENFTNAERLMSQLERSSSTFNDIRREVAVAKAHFFMKQKKYEQAVEPLETAISLGNDRKMNARLSFILGQIHQDAKRGPQAFAAFEQVLKYQPAYEMEFRARLNLALAGVNTPDESVKQLERMLKEEKNKDFKDQIYYAIAEIALDRGDRKEAIKNLELSLQNSSRNITQKAESYLLLADLYFEDENFVNAKLYYDSTLLVMTNTDERFNRVNLLASNLDGIASNIKIIELQDSLLRISRLTDDERRELAYKIKKQQDEERLKALRDKARGGVPGGGNAPSVPARPGVQPPGAASQSKFWAYDDREVKRGQREFQRKWGSRPLEDNWRRSNQQTVTTGGLDIAEAKSAEVLTEDDINEILKDVPDTPEEIAAANRQIEAALFALGGLYHDRIQNNEKSVEALNELIRRYPDTQYYLDALYFLYLAYKDMGDAANTQRYYDIIVNDYPTSNYARILKDPSFLQNVVAKENRLVTYYDETYAAFQARQYQSAYDRISKVGEMFGATNKLQPRFSLLSAMCVGNLKGKEEYVEALKDVIAKYPEAPEGTRAREILRLLGESVGSGPGQQRDLPAEAGQVGDFKVSDDQLHYVIIVFSNDISLNDAKIVITDYNDKYHGPQKLRMNNIYLAEGDSKHPLIAIRRFKDKTEAMIYYDTVKKNKKDFLDESKFNYEVLPISQDNYRELLKSKNLDQYLSFFTMNYLK